MACGSFIGTNLARGEAATSARITPALALATVLVRMHYAFLSPLVVLSIPPSALFQASALIMLVVAIIGLAGTISGRGHIGMFASVSLLAILVWGKASETVLKTGAAQDTAVLIIEFVLILFLMEASSAVISFNRVYETLQGKDDEISQKHRGQLVDWLRSILSKQGKVSLAATGLSIVLLPLAGFTSIGNTQLAFTATMVFLAVVVLLFLLTHRREPEGK